MGSEVPLLKTASSTFDRLLFSSYPWAHGNLKDSALGVTNYSNSEIIELSLILKETMKGLRRLERLCRGSGKFIFSQSFEIHQEFCDKRNSAKIVFDNYFQI